MQRRELLKWMAVSGTAMAAPGWVWAAGQGNINGQRLISIFLRGGADGLTLCAPMGESRYFDLRPTLALAESSALPLDAMFALHPAASGLKSLYDAGELAIIHATGLATAERSHFEAQAAMELGIDAMDSAPAEGWLGRWFNYKPQSAPLASIALDKAVPRSMAGNPSALALGALDQFSLGLDARAQEALRQAYARDPLLAPTAESALIAAEAVAPFADIAPGAGYPEGAFGIAMADAARLIRGDSGLMTAAINSGSWDHHDNQLEQIEPLLSQLGAALLALRDDLGSAWQDTTVIVQTEFGRRLAENASGGTDHGHGGIMLAAGGGVNGGHVYTDWPGLSPDALSAGEDLAVTIDYRQVLAEMLSVRFGLTDAAGIFNDWSPAPWLGIFTPPQAQADQAAMTDTTIRTTVQNQPPGSAIEIPNLPDNVRGLGLMDMADNSIDAAGRVRIR